MRPGCSRYYRSSSSPSCRRHSRTRRGCSNELPIFCFIVCLVCTCTHRKCKLTTCSYVWGAFPQLQLNSSTLDDLSTEGFLFEENPKGTYQTRKLKKGGTIPKTIRDAIKFCQKLGERYLWVSRYSCFQSPTLIIQINHRLTVSLFSRTMPTTSTIRSPTWTQSTERLY